MRKELWFVNRFVFSMRIFFRFFCLLLLNFKLFYDVNGVFGDEGVIFLILLVIFLIFYLICFLLGGVCFRVLGL